MLCRGDDRNPTQCLCGTAIDTALPDPPYRWVWDDARVTCPNCLDRMANKVEAMFDPEQAIKAVVERELANYAGVQVDTAVGLIEQRIHDILATMMPQHPLSDVRISTKPYGPGLAAVDIAVMPEYTPHSMAERTPANEVQHPSKHMRVLVDLDKVRDG